MTHCTAVPPTRRGRLNRWLLALLALLPLMAAAAIVDGPNSYVYAIARGADGITYLGGNFTFWGPQTGGLGALGTADGAVNRNFPPVTGTVYAIQSDGAGGWFIGGSFTAVGGLARTRLARIDSSGAVTAWAPAADNVVYALALSGTTLYAGGAFTAITPPGGSATPRTRLAAIDTTDTGSLTAWAPAAGGTVNALALSGTTLYAGGLFTTITPPGGSATTRNRLAALNTADTGSLAAWDPNADGTVNALVVSGHTVYAGGTFTTLTGELQTGSPTANLGLLNALPCSSGIALPTGQWQTLALPCLPDAPTVAGTLGTSPTANLPAASYGSQWLMYKRDLSGSAYGTLAGTSPLALGAGYWLKSLQAPVGGLLTVAGSATPVENGVTGCQSANGCFVAQVYANGQPLGTKLIGNPFPYAVDWSKVRVRVNGFDTLTPSEAQDANLLSNQVWVWNGTGYDTWSDRAPNQGSLPYFKAFWVKVLPGGANKTIELLIPAEVSTVGPPTPGTGEWLVRLRAGNAQGGWNTQVRLGHWTGAATGYDPADLSAMTPFASPYLTLAFPRPTWGTRKGDYASDFRPADGQAGQWALDLRADPVGTQVVLTWEGDPAILANSRLLDGATVINLANYPNGYPLTLSGKVRRLVWEYLGAGS
jgi:hypothetical protein